MYLKSIELYGFKSFANRTILKFNKGITGIVGPNGSGKSNVADAVRWVLGEQSAKQLRGTKMEDIIFSGTENRKPQGMAYVSISIDNSDHKLPVEYDELTVARRVFRSGESEYLINGRVSRLKDVQELFLDTGIGKEGYSIIGQGQIDKILSGKPEERRELFDEAVGIVKFKRRKSLAEKNLESEKQNLYRINDIILELEKQLEPLESQSKKAKEYLALRDKLRMYDIQMYLNEYANLSEQLKKHTAKLKIVKDETTQCQTSFENSKIEFDHLQHELEQYTNQIDSIKDEINAIQLEKEKSENECRLIEEQIRSLKSSMDHFSERKLQLQVKQAQIAAENSQFTQSKLETNKMRKDLEEKGRNIEQQLLKHNAMIDNIRKDIDSKNSDIIESLNHVSGLKIKIQRYDTMIEQINIRKSELNQRLLTLQSEASGRKNKLKQFYETKERLSADKSQTENVRVELQKRGLEIQDQIDRLHRDLSQKEKDYHRTFTRLQMLQGMAERYDGYGNSVKRIMEQKASYPGIVGVVADIIQVHKEYEIAIETALGGSIQNVVTRDEKTAKVMIEFLKKNRFGRATFLPLTSIVPKQLHDKAQILMEKGVLGIGSDLVQYEAIFANLAVYLLGRVVVTDTIDHALALAKKYHYTLRIVTLEGELLNPGGSISGGHYKNSSSFLGRHRELEDVQKRLGSIKLELDQLNRATDDAHEAKRVNKRRLLNLQESLQELSLKINTTDIHIRQMESSEKNQVTAYEELIKESDELKKQLIQIDQFKGEWTEEQLQSEKIKKDTEICIQKLNKKLEIEGTEVEKWMQEKEKYQIEYLSCCQKQTTYADHISRLEKESSEIIIEQSSLEQELQKTRMNIGSKQRELEVTKQKCHTGNETDCSLIDDLEKLIEKRNAWQDKQKKVLESRDILSERLNQLGKEDAHLESVYEKMDNRRNDLSCYMWDTYELTYNCASEQVSDLTKMLTTEEIKQTITELKRKMKVLGNINLDSVDEYKQVLDRYTSLKMQYDDLIESEEKLKEVILDLDQSMRTQFKEKFVIIQNNFNRVFKELFGGGKGSLELVEDVDLLEAGIRIIAQPPGKKLQNMMQLSGGEKALTAIALLFAIQRLKPSPFCLLDEIEAALDDANVKRYARYLNNLIDDTQFIIITHRRGTMNAADVLYGVTMQEKGVSALVSVNLIENDLIQ